MAHDGVYSLGVWRRTGGRYDDNGKLIRSHIDQLFVMQRVIVLPNVTPRDAARRAPGDRVGAGRPPVLDLPGRGPHPGRDARKRDERTPTKHPFWIARGSSGISSDDQKKIAAAAHVRIYDDTWIVDQREPAAPVDAFRVAEREPNLLRVALPRRHGAPSIDRRQRPTHGRRGSGARTWARRRPAAGVVLPRHDVG